MSEPNIIISGLSRNFWIDDETFKFEIYKLEGPSCWTLEVTDGSGTSTVWDEEFETDEAAHKCLMETLDKEGIAAFKDSNVVPFPKAD